MQSKSLYRCWRKGKNVNINVWCKLKHSGNVTNVIKINLYFSDFFFQITRKEKQRTDEKTNDWQNFALCSPVNKSRWTLFFIHKILHNKDKANKVHAASSSHEKTQTIYDSQNIAPTYCVAELDVPQRRELCPSQAWGTAEVTFFFSSSFFLFLVFLIFHWPSKAFIL